MNEINTETAKSTLDQKESVSNPMLDYNSASNIQLKWIEDGKISTEIAVPFLPPHDGTIQVVDLGCSHGKNSMFVIKQLLDEIQKRPSYAESLRKLIVYHEDLPDNDFDAVMKCANNPDIGYQYHDLVKSMQIEVKTECIGKSYYNQIFKDNSIDIEFCYTSLHWMPEYHPNDYRLIYGPQYGDEELTQWFNDLSSKYLREWLELRHLELKQSGLLVFNILTYFNYPEYINPAWTEVLKLRGLDQKDFTKVTVPVYTRPPELVHAILKEFHPKFKSLICRTVSDVTKWTKASFRAVTENQILMGLAEYPDIFPDESSRKSLYYEFENLVYGELEELVFYTNYEWVVLQKL